MKRRCRFVDKEPLNEVVRASTSSSGATLPGSLFGTFSINYDALATKDRNRCLADDKVAGKARFSEFTHPKRQNRHRYLALYIKVRVQGFQKRRGRCSGAVNEEVHAALHALQRLIRSLGSIIPVHAFCQAALTWRRRSPRRRSLLIFAARSSMDRSPTSLLLKSTTINLRT
jgi:hypothetical protein